MVDVLGTTVFCYNVYIFFFSLLKLYYKDYKETVVIDRYNHRGSLFPIL